MIVKLNVGVGASIDKSCPKIGRPTGGRVLLPTGEGGPKGRITAEFRPHPPLRGTLSQGRGPSRKQVSICLVIDRPYNLIGSALQFLIDLANEPIGAGNIGAGSTESTCSFCIPRCGRMRSDHVLL